MHSVQRYLQKPAQVQAVRWTGDNYDVIQAWCDDHIRNDERLGGIFLYVKHKICWEEVVLGNWIVKGSDGFSRVPDGEFLKGYTRDQEAFPEDPDVVVD